MRSTSVILLMILIALVAVNQARAQTHTREALHLTLEDALVRADSGNFAVLAATADHDVAIADLHRSRSAFLPQLSISNTATATTDPLNVFGFRLKQEIVRQDDFNPALLNDPGRFDHFTTRIDVQQPVLNLQGLMLRKAARYGEEAARLGIHRTREAMAFQVKQAYFGLGLALEHIAVLDTALAAATASREQARRFFDQGLISKADLLEADVHVLSLETRRTSAEFEIRNGSDHLRYLLQIDSDIQIVPSDRLELTAFDLSSVNSRSWNPNRSDILALDRQVDANLHQVRANKSQFLPQVSVFGSYEWNSTQFLGAEARNWGLGALVRWNVFSGFQQFASVEKSKAQLRKSQLAVAEKQFQTRIEVEESRRAVQESARRLDLLTASVQQASESLRIRSDRYRAGLEKTTDVLNAEVLVANQRLARLQGLYEFYVSIFRLEYLLEESLLIH